jgi:hypothetical protein
MIQTDIKSIIRYTFNELIRPYRSYHGCEVKEVLDNGIVNCYIPELSIPNNKDTYIPCKNANRYYSNIIPEVGDFLVVQIQTGNPNVAYYVSFDPAFYEVLNANYDKVIFEFEKGILYYDSSKMIIENDSSKITVDTNSIELKTGFQSTQKMLLGEDTVSLLKDLMDAINNITVMTPVGVSGKVSDMTSNFNTIKSKLDDLLSNKNKNN